MSTEQLNLIGAGGQATVVLDALLAAGTPQQGIAVWTQDAAGAGGTLLGLAIRHLEALEQLSGKDFHVCVGDNVIRRNLQLAVVAVGGRVRSVLHPAAIVSPHATMGAGSYAAARSIVAPGVKIGMGTIINHGAIVDHDCRLGDFVHVAPGATLAGGVRLNDLVLVGAGANILPNRRIGSKAIVGAGAVVISDVPERSVFVGIPAAFKSQRRS